MKKKKQQTLSDLVNNYPTKHPEGFLESEIKTLLKEHYPALSLEQFNKEFGIQTVGVIDNQTILYHCDVRAALNSLVNGISQHPLAWD